MYVPEANRATDEDVNELLTRQGAADWITATERGLVATLMPFVYHPPPSPTGPDRGVLRGHVALKNDHWRASSIGEALVIVRGPDAYITPSWYATKREHGRVVPTWNYVTAHVYGALAVHRDPAWLETHVRALTAKHEGGRIEEWSVDDPPAGFVAGQLGAIVGFELKITRIEAKAKLSQNRKELDVAGVARGLTAEGNTAMAHAMERVRASRGG